VYGHWNCDGKKVIVIFGFDVWVDAGQINGKEKGPFYTMNRHFDSEHEAERVVRRLIAQTGDTFAWFSLQHDCTECEGIASFNKEDHEGKRWKEKP